MKKFKRIKIIILCLSLIVSMFSFNILQVWAAEEETFIGTRVVEYSVDKSDIDNFIDGGRAAFDLILRSNMPQWLQYSLDSKGRDIRLSIQFDFESYDDYLTKLSELLIYTPSIIHSDDEQLLLIESYSAIELLNNIQGVLMARDCIDEKGLNEMFIIENNEIIINSTSYKSKERIYIRPKNDPIIKFDSLDINTKGNEDGSFSRTMTVSLKGTNVKSKDIIFSRFKEVGTTNINDSSEDYQEISVEFDANNQAVLIEKTMFCLRTATSIIENQHFIDEKAVRVERIELFDLESLINVGGWFNYSHTYPTYIKNITTSNENIYVSGDTVMAEDVSEIICKYNRNIKFSSIDIYTDLSNVFGKYKRTITFTVPISIAVDCHDAIKNEIQKRLIRGSIFNIKDKGGKRYYEITFSSFFIDEISKFNSSITNSKRDIKYSSSWIPFGDGIISEIIEISNIYADIVPPDKLTMTYKLPLISYVLLEDRDADYIKKENSTIQYDIKSSDNIFIKFRSLDPLKLVIELLPIIAIIILTINFIKSRKMKHNGGNK